MHGEDRGTSTGGRSSFRGVHYGVYPYATAAQSSICAALLQENRPLMMRKVGALEYVLKSLRTTEGASQSVRDAEHELEAALKELHLPLRSGWMLRVMHAGAILGVHDFWIERVCADLSVSLLPGRLASGAQQAAVLRFRLALRSDEHEHGLVLRCERLHLHRIEQRLFLPQAAKSERPHEYAFLPRPRETPARPTFTGCGPALAGSADPFSYARPGCNDRHVLRLRQ